MTDDSRRWLDGRVGAIRAADLELLPLNGFFVALFVGSAWLFRAAGTRGYQ
jgi:hypothetical protein